MDEERFDSLLLDELYGELDEETSASMRRYAAAHPRAAEKLASLQAVRRAAAPASVAVPDSLEARILSAVRETPVVVPFRLRASSALSRAGAWAMRPQTAMAAVFLLMVGSSVLLVRGRSAKAPTASEITVLERGAPAAIASEAADQESSPDLKSAALAHGTQEVARAAPAPQAPSASGGTAAEGALALGEAKDDSAESPAYGTATKDSRHTYDGTGSGRGWATPPPPAAPLARAAAPKAAAATEGYEKGQAMNGTSDLPSLSAGGGSAPAAAAPTVAVAGKARGPSSDFEVAMAAYNDKRFADATTDFDRIAAGGDVNAALWAARSVRDGSGGCAAAVARFDAVADAAFATVAGQDATLEGGRCYRALGRADEAQRHFQRLLTVPAYMARAQSELSALAGRAQAKAATKQAAPTSAPSKKSSATKPYAP